MGQKMMPLQERNIQGNVNGDVTPVRLDCQCAVVRESCVMLRAAKGDNRVRVVCSRVLSGRGKFESGWSPVARVARVVGVVGIAVLFSGNGVPVNG